MLTSLKTRRDFPLVYESTTVAEVALLLVVILAWVDKLKESFLDTLVPSKTVFFATLAG